MGKKSRTPTGRAKAESRKIDQKDLPPPPPPPEDLKGSAVPLETPALPGSSFKVLGTDRYDDGGVGDLTLLIDLEDMVLRRKRGENEYFSALKADLLPRANYGSMARMSRREQKVSLAQLLFSEDNDDEDKGPSEVYQDQVDGEESKSVIDHRAGRLSQSRASLRLSLLLREPACASLALAELCKRNLALSGKEGAADALRCADKCLEVAGDGFWDGDEVALEAEESKNGERPPEPTERNATTPGLAHPASLKLLPLRVSHLCLRSGLLQRGNSLAALGREKDARDTYSSVFPLLEGEPRCSRVDWERHSLHVNIGNTISRETPTDFAKANVEFEKAVQMGLDHLNEEGGSETDGRNMLACAKRHRCRALKRAGKLDEAKALMLVLIKEQREEDARKAVEAEEKAAEEALKAIEDKVKVPLLKAK